MKKCIFHLKYLLYEKGICKSKIKVKSVAETIDTMIYSDKSLVRFGDGEIWIIEGRAIKLQEYSETLAKRLRNILKYENENILVGIPDIFEDLSPYTERSRRFWEEHVFFSRKTYEKYCNQGRIYENAFFSRPYYIFKNKEQTEIWFQKMKEIWRGKEVVLVEGEGTHSGVGNDLLETASRIERIICPSSNAYFVYEQIKESCLKFEKHKLFLLALGNTAKLLVCDLAEKGYRAIDIGNLDMEYEWFLHKAQDKIPVPKHGITGRENNYEAGYVEYLEQIHTVIEL